jgi:integrase
MGKDSTSGNTWRAILSFYLINDAEFGLLRVRDGKSKNARRYLLLTERVQSMLKDRLNLNDSPWILPNERGEEPFLTTSLDHQHARVRTRLQLPKEAVIHSLRHTMLTRLGESGVDVFTIMKIAGHSSVTVSEKYVHPSSESMQRAFKRLREFNEKAVAALPESQNLQIPATISATFD